MIDLENLPEADELDEEIIEDLEAGLSSIKDILAALLATNLYVGRASGTVGADRHPNSTHGR